MRTKYVLGVAVALALAGCGAGHTKNHPPAPSTVSTVTDSPPSAPTSTATTSKATTSKAPSLVTMRRINGATWQTVVVRTDGSGEVAIFIGEHAPGTDYVAFRLDPAEMAHIRHLVAIAAGVGQTPPLTSLAPSILYYLFLRGRVFELEGGRVPARLNALTTLMSGLIDSHTAAQ